MAYYKPFIDESGLHMPTYNDIKSDLIEQAKIIYGPDIYLEPDSQDYEFISLISDKIHDVMMLAQAIYNNRGPSTATGGGLDGVVKLNGLKRKVQTESYCDVVIKGTPGTQITNGVVSDIKNVNWILPKEVTIPDNGSITVTATCQSYNHISKAGEITKITTPTLGFENVVNLADSVPGQSFETDSMLRARQSVSTAKPSKTVIEGTIGGIAEIPDVTRYRVYENDTNITDENTIPGHSICAVVEGGRDYDIAHEIYLRKTPGCGTYGDISVEIDTGVIYGMQKAVSIKFFRPSYADIFVTVTVKRLPGYVSQITEDIRVKITDYLNSLQIGEDLTISALWYIAQSAIPDLKTPIFSIVNLCAGFSEDSQFATDIDIAFNSVTRGKIENIKVAFIN